MPSCNHHSQPDHQSHKHDNQGHSASCSELQSGDHHLKMIQDFKKRFWISLVLTAPILFFSPMIQSFFSYSVVFPGVPYFLFGIATLVFFYGGWPFLQGGYSEIAQKNPGMMTLIGLAIVVAYLYSSAVVFGLSGKLFFWELATLIDIMLLGHWIEMKSILGSSRSLELLVKMMPSEAALVKGDKIETIKIEKLQLNDVVLVKPGEQVPADGKIIEGSSYLNESMLTGESLPVKKEPGDRVIGGALNSRGSLKVQILSTGKDSYLAKVINLVQEAQKVKSKTQRLADRAAKWLTFIALFSGITTFVIWLFIGQSLVFSIERMVTVMIISCPHALGLAIPLVVAISTAISAQHGLLIRNRTAFENAGKITTLVFDKTGTLTEGEFGVQEYDSFSEHYSQADILKLAAAVEQFSEHPIGAGIVKTAKEKQNTILPTTDFKATEGEGVEGKVEGKLVQIVSPGYLKKHNIDNQHFSIKNAAQTVVFVLIDNELAGYLALADKIRPESYEAVRVLRENKIKTIMVTGDNAKVAEAVSQELQMDSFYANILPHKKLEIVKELQEKGEFVAMTGDGVNDAPALAQANVGIAVGSGTDIAAETADIILVQNNPRDILALILFGKATYRKMMQNLFWATAYNAFAIPLAAGVLYVYGFVISPALGAVLMSLSTVVVAFNAQLLKKNKSLKMLAK